MVTSWFLWVRNPAQLSFCFQISHKAAITVLARAEVSSEGLTMEESASVLTWLLAGFSFCGFLD